MRLTANRNELRKALGITTTLLPSSSNIFLSIRNGRAMLFSTDGQIVIQTALAAACESDRDAILPPRIKRVVSAVKTNNVTLEFLEGKIKVVGKTSKFALREPESPEGSQPTEAEIAEEYVEMCSRLFRRAIRTTAFATQTSLGTQNLGIKSVNIEIEGSTITFMATDGTKIARFVADLKFSNSLPNAQSILLAPNILRILHRLASEPTVKISINNDNFATFGFGENTVVTVRTISGSFPKMDDVFARFEAGNHETIEVANGALARMLAQTAITSTSSHQVVRLSVDRKRLAAEMCTPEVGDASCYIDLASEVNHREVKLDIGLLREGIDAIWHREKITLAISDEDQPIKISTKNYTYIVMPLATDAHQQHAYGDGLGTIRRYIRVIPGLADRD